MAFNQAFATCDNTGNPIQINSNCQDLSINNTVTGVTVASATTVSAFFSTDAITIGASGNVTNTFLNLGVISNGIYNYGLVNKGVIQTLLNQGAISSSVRNGLTNSGNIGTLTNTGSINSDASGNSNGAIVNNNQIGTLNNSGTISATVGTLGNGAYALQQNGHIGTLNNSGIFSAQNNAIYFQPAFSARIDTLINSGTIQGGINGTGSSTFASAIVLGVANSIGTITNTGTIDHSVCSGGTCYAAIENQGGSIGTITNLGNLTSGNTANSGYGIINSTTGAIGTLNNVQHNLTYSGNLPTNYNLIIASASNYGQTNFSNVTGGPLNFGVQQAANKAIPLGSTIFPTAMTGLSDSNISSGTRSGNFSGAFNNISWNLSQAGTSQIWNLSTTASPITSAVVAGSSAATNLAGAFVLVANTSAPITTVNPVSTTTTSTPNTSPPATPASTTTQTTTYTFTPATTAQPTTTTTTTTTSTTSGGVTTVSTPVTTTTSTPTVRPAVVPTTTTSNVQTVVTTPSTTQPITTTTTTTSGTTQAPVGPVLASGAPLAAVVQSLSTAQANQLTQVHAEGYSSNMTIGLEQMAHITTTVMDRIHAPMGSSPSTKVYQDDEGRYVWADAAAVNGTVNNYNNLAGFGYNLYDLIIGGDIKRTKDGGYGVFAGAGTTSMTESQQVTQNFNTTNYYAGLYGALNFSEQVKLSGALGYLYGSTSANRNTPNVGGFTGGNATSSYKTNGVYGAAKLARAYQFEEVTVSPFVGASYSQLWMGGTSEQGGNDFNFGINSATAYTAVTFAGADFIYPLLKGTNNPLSLIGFYKFGYDWFANSNSAHSVTATSPLYGSFTQVGANMGPVSNMFGLGVQGGITKDVSARIGVVAATNSYGQEYGGGAELRFKF